MRPHALVPVLLATLAACGNSVPSNPFDLPTPDTTTLAGTWKGSVTGSYGFSVATFNLKSDSTIVATAENPLYCTVTGRWTVSGGKYASTGRDCDNIAVTFNAPLDKLRLTGTWTASSGRSGTFTVAKQ